MNAPDLLPVPQRRRRHSDEFKAQIMAACRQPGVSIAAIARDNHLNDNLIHKWLRKTASLVPIPSQARTERTHAEVIKPEAPFIPVRVAESLPSQEVIHLELRQNDRVLSITWPANQAHVCIQALGELLR